MGTVLTLTLMLWLSHSTSTPAKYHDTSLTFILGLNLEAAQTEVKIWSASITPGENSTKSRITC
jgi:hypothetical protein